MPRRAERAIRATRWVRDERVLWRRAPDLVVVLGPHSPVPLSLRGTGVAVWEVMDRLQTVPEAVTRLAVEFGADPDVVRADVEPAIERLAAAGALRPAL